MNDDYYRYTLARCTGQDGLQRANTEALICLNAEAYLDMIGRKNKGDKADEKHIKKHKADVFRLSATLFVDKVFELPVSIHADLQYFADVVSNELPDKAIFREMGLPNINTDTLFQQLIN